MSANGIAVGQTWVGKHLGTQYRVVERTGSEVKLRPVDKPECLETWTLEGLVRCGYTLWSAKA